MPDLSNVAILQYLSKQGPNRGTSIDNIIETFGLSAKESIGLLAKHQLINRNLMPGHQADFYTLTDIGKSYIERPYSLRVQRVKRKLFTFMKLYFPYVIAFSALVVSIISLQWK